MGSKGNLGVRGSGGEGKEKVEGGRLGQRKGRKEARGRRVRVKEGERRGDILFFSFCGISTGPANNHVPG